MRSIHQRLASGSESRRSVSPVGAASTTLEREIARLQAGYRLDLRRERSWLRWLGLQTLTGYAEHKRVSSRQIQYYHTVLDKHAWLGDGVAHASATPARIDSKCVNGRT